MSGATWSLSNDGAEVEKKVVQKKAKIAKKSGQEMTTLLELNGDKRFHVNSV